MEAHADVRLMLRDVRVRVLCFMLLGLGLRSTVDYERALRVQAAWVHMLVPPAAHASCCCDSFLLCVYRHEEV